MRGPGPAAPAGSRVNQHGQVVGPPVPGWTARPAPAPATLSGRFVRLEPVGLSHTDDLFAALCGPSDAHRWTYRLQEMPTSRSELAGLLAQAVDDPASVTSAIVPLATGRAEGLATLMRWDPAHGCVEVGAIIYSAALQRTAAATEAMALLARHVFEDLGYRRYEWKCDSGNEPSRRAAARLGFEYEGRFRQAMVYKGRNRDTDWFSMTDAEWPAIASAYARWLDPDNLDGSGRQRTSLARLVSEARTSEQGETWTSD